VSVTSGPLDDLTVDLSNILAADAFEHQASERLMEYESRLQAEALVQTSDAILRHEAALTRQAEHHVSGVRTELQERAARHTAHGEQLEARLADLTARGQEAMTAAATSRSALVQCETALAAQTDAGRNEVEAAARALATHYESLARQEVGSLRATFTDEFRAAVSASQARSQSEFVAMSATHHEVHRALEERAVLVETEVDNRARREEHAAAAATRRLAFAEQQQLQLVQTTELAELRMAAAVRDSGAAQLREQMEEFTRREASAFRERDEEIAAAGHHLQKVMGSAVAERRQVQTQVNEWAAEFSEQHRLAIRACGQDYEQEVQDLQDTVPQFGAEAEDAENQVARLTRDLARARDEQNDSVSAARASSHHVALNDTATPVQVAAALRTPEGAPVARSPNPEVPTFGGSDAPGVAGPIAWPSLTALTTSSAPTSLVPLVRTGVPARIDSSAADVTFNAAGARTAIRTPANAGASASAATVFDLESSAESSGEEFTRKRTQPKTIDLGAPPTAAGYRMWLNELYSVCGAASNRPLRRTLRYVQSVESATTPDEFHITPRRWQAFDDQLFNGVLRYATGELKRTLSIYREERFRQGQVPSGRYALWHALRKFMVEKSTAAQVDLALLINHKYNGDLSAYLDGLDAILMRLTQPPSADLLHACVEPQLRKCRALELDFNLYDRAAEGSQERSIDFLYRAARTYLTRKQLADTRDALLKPATVAVVVDGGKGKGGDADPQQGGGGAARLARRKQIPCQPFLRGTAAEVTSAGFCTKLAKEARSPTPRTPRCPGSAPDSSRPATARTS